MRASPVSWFLFAGLLATVIPPVCAAGIAPAENAATYYRQAFEQLPHDKKDLQAYQNWGDEVIDLEVLQLMNRCEPSRQLLHKATQMKDCDWGWDYSKGQALRMPELNQARTLSNAAAFWTRILFEQKKNDEAIDAVQDVLILSRRIGSGRALVARLVQYGIQGYAVRVSAPYLPSLPPPELQKLSRMLHDLPALQNASDAIRNEGEMTIISIQQAVRQPSPENPLSGKVPRDEQSAAKLIAAFRDLNDEAAKIAAMPPDEAAEAMAGFHQKLAAAPDAARFVPPPDRLAFQNANATEELMLLEAAVAVAKDGPAAANATKDPVGGGPFSYRQVKGGFELVSKLIDPSKNQPVSLMAAPEALK